jgi:hypothetical protein
LELSLNAEVYEYIEGVSPTSGLKIYFHDQNKVPMSKDDHVIVYPGNHFSIQIEKGMLFSELE